MFIFVEPLFVLHLKAFPGAAGGYLIQRAVFLFLLLLINSWLSCLLPFFPLPHPLLLGSALEYQ